MAFWFSTSQTLIQNIIPFFNGENYDFWSDKMKTGLRARDLLEILESGRFSRSFKM